MITKDQIIECISEKLKEDDVYIVEVKASTTNKISILLDSFEGIPISYCVEINRFIEAEFDRDEEDYELEVSSAGASGPFKTLMQYQKNLNKEVLVKPEGANPRKGILEAANDIDFTISFLEKEKVEGKKKKVEVEKKLTFTYDQIVSTELVFKF